MPCFSERDSQPLMLCLAKSYWDQHERNCRRVTYQLRTLSDRLRLRHGVRVAMEIFSTTTRLARKLTSRETYLAATSATGWRKLSGDRSITRRTNADYKNTVRQPPSV